MSKPLILVNAAARKTGNATASQPVQKRYALVSIAAVGLVAGSLGLIAATAEPYGRIDGEGVAPLVVSTITAQHQSGYSVRHREPERGPHADPRLAQGVGR